MDVKTIISCALTTVMCYDIGYCFSEITMHPNESNVVFCFLFLFLFYFIYSFSHSDKTIQEKIWMEVGNAVTRYMVMPQISQINMRKTKCDCDFAKLKIHSFTQPLIGTKQPRQCSDRSMIDTEPNAKYQHNNIPHDSHCKTRNYYIIMV